MPQEERFTVERIVRIYDDSSGEYLYIGPDADGLDCVEIRSCESNHKIHSRVFLGSPARAVAAAQAIIELYGAKP